MPGASKWTATRSCSGDTEHIRLFLDGKAIVFRQLFQLWRDDGFADWYSALLNESPFTAWFWEHPPLTETTSDAHAEFVLVEAPMLARMRPDPAPFRTYFAAGEIAVFRNLGGDAILVAPPPDDSPGYAHLAAFLRGAGSARARALWRTLAATVVDAIADEPVWLSTSGLGVAWPHVRLDSSPKYYQHRPYRRRPAKTGQESDERSS